MTMTEYKRLFLHHKWIHSIFGRKLNLTAQKNVCMQTHFAKALLRMSDVRTCQVNDKRSN